MQRPDDLSRQQLLQIVESVQGYLYLDLDRQGSEFWNPEKPWSGADVCDHVTRVLDEHGLVPEVPQSAEPDDGPQRYVLYDFDARSLASTAIYSSLQEATPDANRLDNVMVVALCVPHDAEEAPDEVNGEVNDEADEKCECRQPGHFCCGVPGILAHIENNRLAPGCQVERCDLCELYPSDQAALEKLIELGMA